MMTLLRIWIGVLEFLYWFIPGTEVADVADHE